MLDDQLVDIVDAAKKAASEARQALSRRDRVAVRRH